MKRFLILFIAINVVGCATPRTKNTDPVMARIMLDADSIDQQNFVRLQKALVSSGKWTVVDRNDAYRAMNKEADRQYKDPENRIADRERYAIWGRQFGIAGIFVGKAQCAPSNRFWSYRGDYDCVQTLTVIDAMTGEILASVDNVASDAVYFYGELKTPASWDKAVEKLNKAFPAKFITSSKHQNIIDREDEAEQVSIKRREPAQVPPQQPEVPQ